MEKKFDFGKHAIYSQRRVNRVTVEFRLQRKECINYETLEKEEMWIFAASGCIWNAVGSDIYSGGQNLDEIAKYITDPRLLTIYEIWKEYHLNDLQPGTKKQMDFLGERTDYDDECKRLGDLFVDKNYKYGHDWLCKPIPESVVQKLKTL